MPEKTELIKDTKYCEIHNQGRYVDNNYTYCIEKIYVKKLKRFEIRFSLYKDLTGHPEKYIARSLDVTELEFISLLKDAIEKNVFTSDMLEAMAKLLSSSRSSRTTKNSKDKEKKSIPVKTTQENIIQSEKEIA